PLTSTSGLRGYVSGRAGTRIRSTYLSLCLRLGDLKSSPLCKLRELSGGEGRPIGRPLLLRAAVLNPNQNRESDGLCLVSLSPCESLPGTSSPASRTHAFALQPIAGRSSPAGCPVLSWRVQRHPDR